MINNCPICGKAFDVLYPHLYRFKRGHIYFCSWSCIRKHDETKGIKKEMNILTNDQKEKAVDIALKGGNPLPYLKECGASNPSTSWKAVRHWASKQDWDDDVMSQLPERFGKARKQDKATTPTVKLDGPIQIETSEPAKVKVIEKPEKTASAFEHRVTGIETEIGDFQYYRRNGYLDWTPIGDNAVVSLRVEEWQNLIRLFPMIAKELGVKL